VRNVPRIPLVDDDSAFNEAMRELFVQHYLKIVTASDCGGAMDTLLKDMRADEVLEKPLAWDDLMQVMDRFDH